MEIGDRTFHLRSEYPDFQDLPWDLPLDAWKEACPRLEEVQRGISRHSVVFVNYDQQLFALKELPGDLAEQEYHLLGEMEKLRLPSVIPAGYAKINNANRDSSVLITRYLDGSLPYRSLFMNSSLGRYREHLLDAMAGLMVQLHLAGVYWGDCSLSNTLFRRDAGALQAYLVDAETSEIYISRITPVLRHHDLEILDEQVTGELIDMADLGILPKIYSVHDTGAYIRQRYQSLWDQITNEPLISQDERFRIQERIRALNNLGFSVGEVELHTTDEGNKLRLRVMVTDRNFHRLKLLSLTGLEAEERQARHMVNEIQETRAMLAQKNNPNMSLTAAAYYWLENLYLPVIRQLEPLLSTDSDIAANLSPAELYCQVLEHKWYLSEKAERDVGHQTAVKDYLKQFAGKIP
jgi:hypothetical protein